MSLGLKIAIFLAVLISEIAACGLVGLRLANQGRLPAALAVVASAFVTLIILAAVLFVVLPTG